MTAAIPSTPPGFSAPDDRRILQLDGLRAIAIIAVFVHHAFGVKLLWMGVDLFFILSGFLITGILMAHRSDTLGRYFGRFYTRRFKRIYPPYLLLLLITCLLFGTAWLRYGYMYVFLMNLVQPLGMRQPDVLSVLWSLALEEQFYLVWPFAVYLAGRARLGWIAGSLIALAPILRGLCTPLFPAHWWIYYLTPFRMDCLATGALLAVLWSKRRCAVQRIGRHGLALSSLSLIGLALLAKLPGFTTTANTRLGNVMIYELSLALCTGLMLWALSGRGVGFLKLAPLRYIGRISYSIYLIHPTALFFAHGKLHTVWAVNLAASAATLVYAALSWHFLEQPLLGHRPAEATTVLTA